MVTYMVFIVWLIVRSTTNTVDILVPDDYM